jgi:hypothetical protein
LRLNYIKDSTHYNSLSIEGGTGGPYKVSGVFNKNYPVKVVYIKKYNQLVAFTGKKALA